MKAFLVFLSFVLLFRLILFYFFVPGQTLIQPSLVRETTIFTQAKDHIRHVYSFYLGGEENNLLMGIVFGQKPDYESNKLFATTGVLHVVAASGMNVTMLTSFVLVGLLLFLRRQYALFITAGIVILYTAMADFQPSIIRAAIMALFALGAGVVGRQNTSLLALFLAGFLMIFWSPEVMTSIGFILSFAATLGIIMLDPIFKRTILKSDSFEDFRTTFSAQIATTPILLFFFGTYSPISIVSNMLVLWTIPPLMILGGIGALLGFISPILAAPFILLSLPLLSYFLNVINFLNRFAVQIELEYISWTLIAGYYLVLAGVIFWFQNRIGTKPRQL